MSKISIPENLTGKELFRFLVANKSALISQKKSMLKRTEPVFCAPQFIYDKAPGTNKDISDIQESAIDTGILRVKVAANTCMWMDSQKDVLLPGGANRSIKERKGLIPHIHDHLWEVGAEVGDVADIYYQDIPLKQLGYPKEGKATVLIFETDIIKSYNEKIYLRYKAGKVKQHSIGLQYTKIELAINDSEYEKEIDFWNKYIEQIINREEAEESGFFWVIPEYKLMENSAVLLGSNILTPTLEIEKSESTVNQPPVGTGDTPQKSDINWDKIAEKFLQIN